MDGTSIAAGATIGTALGAAALRLGRVPSRAAGVAALGVVGGALAVRAIGQLRERSTEAGAGAMLGAAVGVGLLVPIGVALLPQFVPVSARAAAIEAVGWGVLLGTGAGALHAGLLD